VGGSGRGAGNEDFFVGGRKDGRVEEGKWTFKCQIVGWRKVRRGSWRSHDSASVGSLVCC
jgi:hypothetical protein